MVGLGNVGEKYKDTRHNVGFLVANELARLNSTTFSHKKKISADVAETNSATARLMIVKPTTYMNRSGEAVSAVLRFFKPREIIVVHDDADLPFGEIRVRENGSSAGHNGVGSIIERVGENFTRVRIGIGRPENTNVPLEDWVLQKWSESEAKKMPEIVARTVEIIMQRASKL